MRKLLVVLSAVLLFAAPGHVRAEKEPQTFVLTASNTVANHLLIYDVNGALVQTVSTQGQGGVGGNAGGVTAKGHLVAAVNFGSNSVAVLGLKDDRFHVRQLMSAVRPVSVAFGNEHLYILGTTTVESHQMYGSDIASNPDGVVTLLRADGSAAQVGVVTGQLVIAEKSNTIETVNLNHEGAVTGAPTLVHNIPANVDTPFGLVTRGNDAYVTIAHADEISLVRSGKVLTTTPSVTEHSPCWLTLVDRVVGSFVYSSNSPSKSLSRYAVYGQRIVQDLAVAVTLHGAPTDITSGNGLLAVVDVNGPASHLSIFDLDEDGNLMLRASSSVSHPVNGVAIVSSEDRD
jgi:hypothetical protein